MCSYDVSNLLSQWLLKSLALDQGDHQLFWEPHVTRECLQEVAAEWRTSIHADTEGIAALYPVRYPGDLPLRLVVQGPAPAIATGVLISLARTKGVPTHGAVFAVSNWGRLSHLRSLDSGPGAQAEGPLHT